MFRAFAFCIILPLASSVSVDESLRGAIASRLEHRYGTNNFQIHFSNARELSGSGSACTFSGNTLSYSAEVHDNDAGVTCDVQVSFSNGLYCSGTVGTKEYSANYYVTHSFTPSGLNNAGCIKVTQDTGSDAAAGPNWPCQGWGTSDGGCWYEMDGNTIYAEAGFEPNPASAVEIGFMWVAGDTSAVVTKTTKTSSIQTTKGSASSLEFGVSASVSYGPASASADMKSSMETSFKQILDSSSSVEQTVTKPACEPGQNRWNYVLTLKSGSAPQQTIQTKIWKCTSSKYPRPQCPANFCGETEPNSGNCGCCHFPNNPSQCVDPPVPSDV